MKNLIRALLLAVMALTCVSAALAESPFLYQIPGAEVTRFSAVLLPATADTLWFQSASPRPLMAAKTRAEAWYPPKDIPVGTARGGSLDTDKKRVRGVFLAAKSPFWFQVFYPNAANSNADKGLVGGSYVTVDSSATVAAAGPASTRGDKYPCRALITGFPDSVIVKGCASGDSVRIFVGY